MSPVAGSVIGRVAARTHSSAAAALAYADQGGASAAWTRSGQGAPNMRFNARMTCCSRRRVRNKGSGSRMVGQATARRSCAASCGVLRRSSVAWTRVGSVLPRSGAPVHTRWLQRRHDTGKQQRGFGCRPRKGAHGPAPGRSARDRPPRRPRTPSVISSTRLSA